MSLEKFTICEVEGSIFRSDFVIFFCFRGWRHMAFCVYSMGADGGAYTKNGICAIALPVEKVTHSWREDAGLEVMV